jgi:peroxiredoxin
MKRITNIIFFVTLLFSVISAQEEQAEFYTKVGQKVPSFEFKSIDGKSYKIEDFKGKYVLINFFATWCGPCMKEMPEMEKEIWDKLKKEDFVVIAIGREHTIDELKKFNEEKKFTFIIGADPNREIYSKFAPSLIPRNYVLDKTGKIIYQKDGYSNVEFFKLTTLLKDLFKEN